MCTSRSCSWARSGNPTSSHRKAWRCRRRNPPPLRLCCRHRWCGCKRLGCRCTCSQSRPCRWASSRRRQPCSRHRTAPAGQGRGRRSGLWGGITVRRGCRSSPALPAGSWRNNHRPIRGCHRRRPRLWSDCHHHSLVEPPCSRCSRAELIALCPEKCFRRHSRCSRCCRFHHWTTGLWSRLQPTNRKGLATCSR